MDEQGAFSFMGAPDQTSGVTTPRLNMETEPSVDEDSFLYSATKVFDIIAPHIQEKEAYEIFAKISAALRRAQEASAEKTVLLEISENAQRRERELRALDANRHMSRVRELQALVEVPPEKEAVDNAKQQSLGRRLAAEIERAADLEHRLAESDAEKQRLEKTLEEVRDEKQALFESWKSTLEREVAAAKAAVIQEATAKIEKATMRRMGSLSPEVSLLRQKIRDLQVENAVLKKILNPRPPTTIRLGVLRPGEVGSKQFGENEASTGLAGRERHRRNAATGFAVVPIRAKSRHHFWIDGPRDALGGKEESTRSSQPMTDSSQRQGKDGERSTRETRHLPVPSQSWVGATGGSRQRGLGNLPRPSSFRPLRMIEFAGGDGTKKVASRKPTSSLQRS